MMAMIVDRITAVGGLKPAAFGEEMMLRLWRPVEMPLCVPLMQALYFLQEDDVRIETAQAIAQVMDYHAAVELRESLVDVVGADAQWFHAG